MAIIYGEAHCKPSGYLSENLDKIQEEMYDQKAKSREALFSEPDEDEDDEEYSEPEDVDGRFATPSVQPYGWSKSEHKAMSGAGGMSIEAKLLKATADFDDEVGSVMKQLPETYFGLKTVATGSTPEPEDDEEEWDFKRISLTLALVLAVETGFILGKLFSRRRN